jgi:hypothetical protein
MDSKFDNRQHREWGQNPFRLTSKKPSNQYEIYLPSKMAEALKDPANFYIFYGGRGGGKSMSIVYYLIFKHWNDTGDIVFFRKTSTSLVRSSYEGVKKCVEKIQSVVKGACKVIIKNDEIVFNGITFKTAGVNDSYGTDTNYQSTESTELLGFVVEEAQQITENSFNSLLPTILRKQDVTPGYFLMNPTGLKDYLLGLPDKLTTEYGEFVISKTLINIDDNLLAPSQLLMWREMQRKTLTTAKWEAIWTGAFNIEDDCLYDIDTINQLKQIRNLPNNFNKDYGVIVMGVDVAFSHDTSVIIIRQKNRILCIEQILRSDTFDLSDIIFARYNEFQVDFVNIDASGVSKGVIDVLTRQNVNVNPIGFGDRKVDQNYYYNKRDWMYDVSFQWCKQEAPELRLFNKEQERHWLSLVNELAFTMIDVGKTDILKLVPKVDIKKKLGISPDFADAFALTFGIEYDEKYIDGMLSHNNYSQGSYAPDFNIDNYLLDN